MRIALVLAIALAASGCAKKSKPAAAPAMQSAPAPTEAAPGGASDDESADKAGDGGPAKPGDPCDGGETKKK